ncbi:MAG: hypothetical protein KIT08_01510 [Anaerolineales bacterium]|nr:MAG: hypothetical protein KIT08_01510 [Anaerolineales bacterium]
MDVPQIEMDKDMAQAAYEEYKAGFERFDDSEYERLATVYRHLAQGKRILDLKAAMTSAGLNEDGLPILAVARADARLVRLRTTRAGETLFWWDRGARKLRDGDAIEFPAGTFPGIPLWDMWNGKEWSRKPKAMVPIVPPQYRPKHDLGNYHIVWDPTWTFDAPTPPIDPILCKRIDNTFLFVVLAVWDLTDIERAVIMGTRG